MSQKRREQIATRHIESARRAYASALATGDDDQIQLAKAYLESIVEIARGVRS